MNAEVYSNYIDSIYRFIYTYVCMLYSLQVSAHFIFSKHMLLVIGYDVLKNTVLLKAYFMSLQQGIIILSKEVNVYSLYICKLFQGLCILKCCKQQHFFKDNCLFKQYMLISTCVFSILNAKPSG